MSDSILTENTTITVSVDVTNSSNIEAKEVVQMYVKDLYGEVTRPTKELKAFEKISLKPGETKTVSFDIDTEMLAFTGLDMMRKAEKGAFDVMVGSSSASVQSLRFYLN